MASDDRDRDADPLLATEADPRRMSGESAPSEDGLEAQPHPDAKGHWVWFLTLSAGISGLLFGYDTASISSALLYLAPSLSTPESPVTTWDKSMITSATSLGALFGGLVAGVAADRWGRKSVIFMADVVFFVGALWQALSVNVADMVFGRAVVGIGVGVGSLVVPLYISELAPPSYRGRLVVISVLFITIGQLVAYFIGLVLSPPTMSADIGWRWMLGLGGFPALIQALLMLVMPETPRWQLLHRRRKAAAATISQVYGTTSTTIISQILTEIEAGIPTSTPPFLQNLRALVTVPSNRRALTIACFLQFLQQACGFNSLMYFSATIFAMLGFQNPTATAMVVAATNALATVAAFVLIDRVGRRNMLLRSLVGMAIGLLLCALGFLGLPALLPSASTTIADDSDPSTIGLSAVLIGIVLFVASYAIGLGPIPWLCQSEFFPIQVRGLGTGLATATNWTWNLIVAATFLGIVEAMGAPMAFVGYAVVVVVGWAVSKGIYPETGGLGMEEIEGVLREGWGVNR